MSGRSSCPSQGHGCLRGDMGRVELWDVPIPVPIPISEPLMPLWVLPGLGPCSPDQAVGVWPGWGTRGWCAMGSSQPLLPAPSPLGSCLMIPRW